MNKKILLFILLVCMSCGKIKTLEKSLSKEENPPQSKPAENYDIEIMGVNEGLLSNNIKQVLVTKDDILCLTGTGLIRISKKTGRIINYDFTELVFTSFDQYEDRFYLIEKNGIYNFIQDKVELVFKSPALIDELAGTSAGLYCVTKNSELYKLGKGEKSFSLVKRFTNASFSLIKTDEDKIYLQDRKDLYCYDIEEDHLTNLISSPEGAINDFLVDNDDVYFGSKDLYCFDHLGNQLKKIISFSSNQQITFLFKDQDNLYIGKDRGITRLDLSTGESSEILESFYVHDAFINDIIRDENMLLISTRNYGLIKYIMDIRYL